MSQYPSNRARGTSGNRSRPAPSPQPGISRESRFGTATPRQSAYDARGDARRGYSQRPSGGGRRPSGNGRRTPPPRRKRGIGGFIALFAVLAVLAALLFVILKPGVVDKPEPIRVDGQPTASTSGQTSDVQTGVSGVTSADQTQTQSAGQSQYASIAEQLSREGAVQGLSADQMVQVENLSINQGLPEEWLNVLLLGTDERSLEASARTDAMIICSINRTTGEVKLTNIMRDLNVTFDDIGQYNGDYRINAANYFGGPELAMKTVNELFEMNIQYYVMVNFFGFQKIAERLGGVDVDVSEQEMEMINVRIKEQYKIAVLAGVDESDLENKILEEYGENTHLDGRQTLAYARLRKTDGGDYRRAERQQQVLGKLLEKVKQLGVLQTATLATDMLPWVKTNMDPEYIMNIASTVLNNGLSDMKSFRLPVVNTYYEGVRNNDSRLWDCDFAANAIKLYDFIYT